MLHGAKISRYDSSRGTKEVNIGDHLVNLWFCGFETCNFVLWVIQGGGLSNSNIPNSIKVALGIGQ